MVIRFPFSRALLGGLNPVAKVLRTSGNARARARLEFVGTFRVRLSI